MLPSINDSFRLVRVTVPSETLKPRQNSEVSRITCNNIALSTLLYGVTRSLINVGLGQRSKRVTFTFFHCSDGKTTACLKNRWSYEQKLIYLFSSKNFNPHYNVTTGQLQIHNYMMWSIFMHVSRTLMIDFNVVGTLNLGTILCLII